MSFEGPEIHAPHKSHGANWLEILLSVSALVVSFASIAIALHHGQIMEKLVEANSLPYLQVGTSNAAPDGRERISLDMENDGVGPAHEFSLKLKVGDHYVTTGKDLLVTVLGPEEASKAVRPLRVLANQEPTRFIPGGTTRTIFSTLRTADNAAYWDKLDHSRLTSWSIETCYCSVFHECWRRVGDDEPRPVKECRRDPAREFTP